MVDGYALLEGFILSNAALKAEDFDAVKKLILLIRLVDDPTTINQVLASQQEAEALAIYLKNRYTSILAKYDMHVSSYKAQKLMELGGKSPDGYKLAKTDKENYLLSYDARYVALLESRKPMQSLLDVLSDLFESATKRDRKVEQLSNNYRQEVRVDAKT